MKEFGAFSLWRSLTLIAVFLVATPLTIFTATFSLLTLTEQDSKKQNVVTPSNLTLASSHGVSVFSSSPKKQPSISGLVVAEDARIEIVRQYLNFYNSILEPHARTLIEAADHYQLDFRLLPAIAQQESNLCKWIPEGGHNCWGWGIHKEGTLGFETFDHAIWTVAKGLKEQYIDKGYVTPEEIMSKYTPSSKGSWAHGVNQFMSELQ